MKPLTVTYCDKMVNIVSDEISFGYISGMYMGNVAGEGLQVNAGVDALRAGKMCHEISKAVMEYNRAALEKEE